jgi:hypothetical protein
MRNRCGCSVRPVFLRRALVAITATLLMAGCTGGEAAPSAEQDTPTSSSQALASDPSESVGTAEADEVLAVYRRLQEVVNRAYADPEGNYPELAEYAYGRALADIHQTLFYYRERGIRFTGKPSMSPRVTFIDVDASPPTATVTDCFDDSKWIPVDAETGESVAAPGQNHRYRVTSTAQQHDGRWFIVSDTPDRSRIC